MSSEIPTDMAKDYKLVTICPDKTSLHLSGETPAAQVYLHGGFNWECSNCPCFSNTNFNYKVKMKLKITVDAMLRWKLY